jgi:hypothetical protein
MVVGMQHEHAIHHFLLSQMFGRLILLVEKQTHHPHHYLL